MNNDQKTTWLGAILATLIALNVNWSKLFQFDPDEIGKAVGAIVTVLLTRYINKPDKKITPEK